MSMPTIQSGTKENHDGLNTKPLSGGLILLMAVACGIAVSNLYYNQPLLAQIAHSFHTTAKGVGTVSMLTQIGYAVGMFLFVPLGDMRERRRLITILSLVVTVFLLSVALSENLAWLYAASLAVGLTTVVPQVIVPLAAQMAPKESRGRVIGTVMSGLLIGILLARTVSGFVGHSLGWRAMYWIAAGMMLLLAIALRAILPKSYPTHAMTYGQLMRSIGHLVASERTLREAALVGAMQFGSFSVFWTSLAFFLEGAPYHLGSQAAGLFGLVGVVGASIAPVAGRMADRFRAKSLVGVAVLITLLSFASFLVYGHLMWGLIVGVILLDMGVQGAQILNQTRIYSLVPEARNRINTVYMVTSFLGGALGSTLGSMAWTTWGWTGVCIAGGSMVLAGFVVWTIHRSLDRMGAFRGSGRQVL